MSCVAAFAVGAAVALLAAYGVIRAVYSYGEEFADDES